MLRLLKSKLFSQNGSHLRFVYIQAHLSAEEGQKLQINLVCQQELVLTVPLVWQCFVSTKRFHLLTASIPARCSIHNKTQLCISLHIFRHQGSAVQGEKGRGLWRKIKKEENMFSSTISTDQSHIRSYWNGVEQSPRPDFKGSQFGSENKDNR